MGSLFSGSSVEECLQKASVKLNIPQNELKYTVVKNEKHFFKRSVEIEIIQEIQEENDVNKKKDEEKIKNSIEINRNKELKVLNHGAKVQNGNIIVDDFNDDTAITLEPCKNLVLIVNGEQYSSRVTVTSNDKIEYKFIEQEPIRNVNIGITTNKLEAYITMKFVPQDKFKLVDCDFKQDLKLEVHKVGETYPPKYTVSELKNLLSEKGIRNGLLENELQEICNEYNIEEKLVAKGLPALDDIPDQIKLYFKDSNELVDYDTDENKVDYRNRYLISNVNVGDVIAEFIPGKQGQDGIDVLGLPIKRKTSKKLLLKAGENCTLKDNKVISNVEGRPSIKGNTVFVNKVYKIEEVNLKSGNINFVGNVEVSKNVEEGMEVVAGEGLTVGKNVEAAILQAGGQVIISGNAISSTIKSGADNVEMKMHTDNLLEYKECINQLIHSAEQLKDNNLLGKSRYGEIVKLLIENKFKRIPDLSKKILNYNVSNGIKESDITTFIINRMLGLGPLKINEKEELSDFVDELEEEIEEMQMSSLVAADIYIDYAQGSTVEASGNVYITGKGQYTSNIIALGNIEFVVNNSVCRGGVLSAGNEIKLKTVGSSAGVSTILKVPKNGKITAEIAYNNTVFCFGEKQLLLEISSKDVEAYLDKKGEIVIDKFVL